jgi:hypothetical protein
MLSDNRPSRWAFQRRTIFGTTRTRTNALTTALLRVAILTCVRVGPTHAQTTPAATQSLSVEGRTNDGVRLASSGAFVVAVWGASTGSGMDVFSAVSRDGGVVFGAPVRVNSTPFDARVGGEQPPQVTLMARNTQPPVIRVVGTAKSTDGGRLRTAVSTDGGSHFSAAVDVPGSVASGNRGWASVASVPGDGAFAMWLDHRDVPAMTHSHRTVGAGPAPPAPDPVERASHSRLWVASLDGAAAPRAIASSVCYCCKTSFAAGPDGALYGVWRHVFPGSMRDMALTVSRDAGRTFSAPVRVSADGWSFDGCPDNGPALLVDAERRVHVVWPSPADARSPNTMTLFHAVSRDGRRFSPRVQLPTAGPAGHVNVSALAAQELLVTWDELSAAGRVIRAARATTSSAGQASFRLIELPEASLGKYPAATATPTGALLAWSQAQHGRSEIRLHRVVR